MKTIEDIDYEIAFIETELEANEFIKQTVDEVANG
jgi:hypothetical protein